MSNLGPIHTYRSDVDQFIPLLPGDCALPDALRCYKVVDFREKSEAAFAEVLATLRYMLLPKLLSGELGVTAATEEMDVVR